MRNRSEEMRQRWSGIVNLITLCAALEVPLRLVFGRAALAPAIPFETVTTIIYLIDFLIRLVRPAWLNSPRGPKKHRFSDWKLVTDVLATVPFRFFLPGTPLELLRLLKLVRTAEFFRQLHYRGIQNWGVLRLVFFVFWFVLSVHWLACGWILLGADWTDQDLSAVYISALYWCISTLSSVGYGDIVPRTTAEQIYSIGVMIVGVAMYSYIIGNVATILAGIQPARTRYKENMDKLSSFMRYRNIPASLQKRIQDYFSYSWDKTLGYDESQVISELPPSLMTEVVLFLKRDVIGKVPFLKGASDELVREIALQMRPVVYMPGDVVFKAGEKATEMYFVSRGRLEVLAKDGVTVYTTLKDGDFFGEIALLLNTSRTASVRALEYCDLYALGKETFERILAHYPDFAAHVHRMTRERQERGM
ncbi:MAG: cyclic nucleotide-binding domain-containing protein [Ignavibacteria bacterium]|nr:cyclic nucleotide-binding domain-containing protein [Ignavibacteria bacterium]